MPANKSDATKPAGRSSSPATAPGVGAAPPSPPEPSLEEAAALAETEAAEAAADHGLPRATRCPEPECREQLERYSGSNPHKQGSYVCSVHGRIRL